jgi:rhodanese-related sulfurtransferase
VKKDTLINLYWILDAVQKGSAPTARHVDECFITIRDELLLPDTEDIVVHIRGVLEKSQATADVLSQALIDNSRRAPLSEQSLLDMMATLPGTTPGEVTVAFARLVEAAHGVQP